MAITRREFLKYTAVMGSGLLLGSLFDLAPVKAYAEANPPVWENTSTSICCFCGVGCGVLVGYKSTAPYVTYVQGDPDHPINNGSLCSKGSSLAQLRTVDGALNPKRLTQPLYRAAGAATWSSVSWDWTLDTIVSRIRTTRDNPWDTTVLGPPGAGDHPVTITRENIDGVATSVRRCTGIASLGGAALDNEECYLLVKLMRALGVVYIEHQARI